MPARGRLIALEGIDGCGKSTQAARAGRGPRGPADLRARRHAGRGPAARAAAGARGAPPSPRAEALLMAADRAEHVTRVLEPALAAGEWVVSDRYAGSTIAYQGYGQGLEPAALGELVRLGHRRPGRGPLDPGRRQRRGGGGPSGRRRPRPGRPDGAPRAPTSPSGCARGSWPRRRPDPDALGRRRRDGGGRRADGAYRGRPCASDSVTRPLGAGERRTVRSPSSSPAWCRRTRRWRRSRRGGQPRARLPLPGAARERWAGRRPRVRRRAALPRGRVRRVRHLPGRAGRHRSRPAHRAPERCLGLHRRPAPGRHAGPAAAAARGAAR